MSVSFHGMGARAANDGGGRVWVGDMNLANGNVPAFLDLLAIPYVDPTYGTLSVHDARRAIIRARATFDRRAERFTRDARSGSGAGGCRFWEQGIDTDRLASYVERFASVVESSAALGLVEITWG